MPTIPPSPRGSGSGQTLYPSTIQNFLFFNPEIFVTSDRFLLFYLRRNKNNFPDAIINSAKLNLIQRLKFFSLTDSLLIISISMIFYLWSCVCVLPPYMSAGGRLLFCICRTAHCHQRFAAHERCTYIQYSMYCPVCWPGSRATLNKTAPAVLITRRNLKKISIFTCSSVIYYILYSVKFWNKSLLIY